MKKDTRILTLMLASALVGAVVSSIAAAVAYKNLLSVAV